MHRIRLTALALLIAFVVTAGLEAQDRPRGFGDSPNPHVEKWAYVLMTSVWPDPVVYVCWENPSDADTEERQWVKDAVTRTWQEASALEFKGWGPCAERVRGIRMLIEDSGPHVVALGRGLDNVPNGMVLNFTFDRWSTTCKKDEAQRQECIESIAVHEFGHAIGFAHEQNRPDAPGECAKRRSGSDGDKLLTPYDPHSVMNYCNPVYNNDGVLSDLDAQAVAELYPRTAGSESR